MTQHRESETSPSRRARLRERNEDAVARNAAAVLADTSYDRLRGARVRRTLCVAFLIGLGSLVACFWSGATIPATLLLIATVVVFLLLRVSVRSLADLPDEYLDERQTRVRDRAYLESYRVLASVAVLVPATALLGFIVTGSDPEGVQISLTLDQVQAVFWTFTGLALALPSLVLALREPRI